MTISQNRVIITVALPIATDFPLSLTNLGNETSDERMIRIAIRERKAKVVLHDFRAKGTSATGVLVLDKITDATYRLVDATIQARKKEGSGEYRRRIATFVFEKGTDKRAKRGTLEFLDGLLEKRYGTAMLSVFTDPSGFTELVYHFEQECDETERGTEIEENADASNYGFQVHKKKPKMRQGIAA